MKQKFVTLIISVFVCMSALAEDSEVQSISNKYKQWILGSHHIDYSNPYIQTRYKEMIRSAKFAIQNFKNDKNNDKLPDFLLTEQLVVSKHRNNLKTIFNKYLFPLSLAYNLPDAKLHGLSNPYYKSEVVKLQILEIINNLHEHGWSEGIDIGILQMDSYTQTGYIGYYSGMSLHCLGYALSIFLNKEFLQTEGVLNRELSTLNFISKEVGPEFDTPVLWEQNGFNTDAIRSMFNVRFCYILSIPSNEWKLAQEQMSYFSKMMNKSLQVADGWADMIKPDFMGYHHQGAYLNAYAPQGFHTSAIFLNMLDGTSYQVGKQAMNNLAQAVLQMRIYCNLYDVPRGVAGRFPDNLNMLIKNISTFAYVSQLDTPFNKELEGAFARLWKPQYKCFEDDFISQANVGISYVNSIGEIEACLNVINKEVEAEKAPVGFWYYPYGGLGIYRQDDWLVSFVGCSKYIWDYESSKSGENKFGRFARAGVLRILAGGEPISSENSGYADDGWDWCKLPGATTVGMPFKDMKPVEYNNSHRQFTPESYLGGVNIDDNNALVSIKYVAPIIYDTPLRKLKACKSYFFFDDFIIAMGTNVTATSSENYSVQTTLFQNCISGFDVETYVNGEAIKGKYEKVIKDASAYITDAQGHSYYIPKCSSMIIERKKQKAPNDDDTQTKSSVSTNARILHGAAPTNDKYLYYIKVRGGAEGAEWLSKNSDECFDVIQQDENAHVVHYINGNTTGFALFEAGKPINDDLIIETDTPCLAMVKQIESAVIEIAVQNPELGKLDNDYSYNVINKTFAHTASTVQPVQLTLSGGWKLGECDDRIRIVSKNEKQTIICFNCFDGDKIRTKLYKE